MGLGQRRVAAGTGRNGGCVTWTLVASLVDFAGNAEVTALWSTACVHVSCLASAALLVPQPRMSPWLYPHHQDLRRLGLWRKRDRETRVRRTGLCSHPCGQSEAFLRIPPRGGHLPEEGRSLPRSLPDIPGSVGVSLQGVQLGSVSGVFCSAEEMAAD